MTSFVERVVYCYHLIIIGISKEEISINNCYYLLIGKFDITKYNKNIKTTTNEVILTIERLKHIFNEHPEVIENLNKLNDFINNPDIVCIQQDRKDTIWIIKKISSNLKITIRLKYSILKRI